MNEYFIKRDLLKQKFNATLKIGKSAKIRNFAFNKINNKSIKNFLSKDNSNLKKIFYKIKTEKNLKTRFLFLSDLHLEVHDNTDKIKRSLKDEIFFDFIVFGGDYFDNDENVSIEKERWLDLISFLKTKTSKIFGILGNHDGKNAIELVSKDITLLVNDSIAVNGCYLYGVEDYVTFNETIDFRSINENDFNIMLSHTPDFIDKIENKYDLMLSGHTHGGQISLFGYKPVKHCKNKNMFYGNWNINGINGITTSGVGCSGYPYRIGVNPEITIISIS